MTDSPAVRRLLWALTATCLVAGVLAAAVESGGDGGSTTAAGSTSTTTTAAPAGDFGDAGDGGGVPVPGGGSAGTTPPAPPTTAAAPGAPTTSPAPPASTATTAGAPASGPMPATVPARAGTYRYKLTADEESSDATARFDDHGESAGVRRFTVTMKRESDTIVDDVRWSATEVRVAKTVATGGGFSIECDWEPDFLERRNDLAIGQTWSADSSCVATIGATTLQIRRTSNAKVTGSEDVAVGGKTVRVWVIETTGTYSLNGRPGDTSTTQRFSPAHGLVVRESTRSEQQSYDLELLSVDPS